MINFLKAELFRQKKDKVLLIAPAAILIGYGIVTMLAGLGSGCDRVSLLTSSWQEQYYFILKIAVFLLSHVWTQEFRNDTLKNVYTSGCGVEKFFLAKLAVQFLECIMLFIWAIVCFMFCCMMLSRGDGELASLLLEKLTGLCLLLLYAFAEITILDLIYLIIKKETLLFILYFVIADQAGGFISDLTHLPIIEKLSIGYGYAMAVSLHSDASEKLMAAAVMPFYAVIAAVGVMLLLKKGIRTCLNKVCARLFGKFSC